MLIARARGLALGTITGVINLIRAAQIAWNVAMATNPIGLVVTALALLGAGLITAYNNSVTFRAAIQGAFAWVKAFGLGIVELFQALRNFDLSGTTQAFKNLGTNAGKAFNDAYEAETEKAEKQKQEREKQREEERVKAKEEEEKKETRYRG